MLRYLVTVTKDLISAGILTGLLCAYIGMTQGKRGTRIFAWGAGMGIAAAAVMAYLKNATSKIDTGIWNLRIFTLAVFILLVYLIFYYIPVFHKNKYGGLVIRICASALAFLYLFHALPDDLAYPFTFSLNGEPVFSTAYIYRFLGWLFGVMLMITAFFAVERSARRMNVKTVGIILNIVMTVNAVRQISGIASVILTRRMIRQSNPLYHNLFVFARHTSNYGDWFIYISMLIALIMPVILWYQSFHVQEPYENPAQHRKIRAAWRDTRRWASLTVICFLLASLNLTVVNAYNNRPVELSPAEECEIRGDHVYVALSQLDDGHLHRFVYTTPNQIDVRFIIIKKPNASSYGVGLDACEICGETGYFERNGQIVCKLCDVVMNINTIGFKGGCNPIVIDYSVENGYIIIPTYTLIDNEKEFK